MLLRFRKKYLNMKTLEVIKWGGSLRVENCFSLFAAKRELLAENV